MLSGYKTYIASAALILTALTAYFAGEQSLVVTIEAVLAALGFGFLRAGVKTDTTS